MPKPQPTLKLSNVASDVEVAEARTDLAIKVAMLAQEREAGSTSKTRRLRARRTFGRWTVCAPGWPKSLPTWRPIAFRNWLAVCGTSYPTAC